MGWKENFETGNPAIIGISVDSENISKIIASYTRKKKGCDSEAS